MVALPIREQVIHKLDELNEDQLLKLMRYIDVIDSSPNALEGEMADDPLIGFISGPTDLAERSEEILATEFGIKKSYPSDE